MVWRKYKQELLSIPDKAVRGVLKYAWLPKLVYDENIPLEEGERYDKQLCYIWLDYYIAYEQFDSSVYKWTKKDMRKIGDYNCNEETINILKNSKYTDDVAWLYWEIKRADLNEVVQEVAYKVEPPVPEEETVGTSFHKLVAVMTPGNINDIQVNLPSPMEKLSEVVSNWRNDYGTGDNLIVNTDSTELYVNNKVSFTSGPMMDQPETIQTSPGSESDI